MTDTSPEASPNLKPDNTEGDTASPPTLDLLLEQELAEQTDMGGYAHRDTTHGGLQSIDFEGVSDPKHEG